MSGPRRGARWSVRSAGWSPGGCTIGGARTATDGTTGTAAAGAAVEVRTQPSGSCERKAPATPTTPEPTAAPDRGLPDSGTPMDLIGMKHAIVVDLGFG